MDIKQPVYLLGNVGNDPEFRRTPTNNKPVCNINLACHSGKDQEGKTLTSWISVTFWNDLAIYVNDHISKGTRLIVGGQLPPESSLHLDEKGVPVPGKDGKYHPRYEFTAFELFKVQRTYQIEDLSEPESVPEPV